MRKHSCRRAWRLLVGLAGKARRGGTRKPRNVLACPVGVQGESMVLALLRRLRPRLLHKVTKQGGSPCPGARLGSCRATRSGGRLRCVPWSFPLGMVKAPLVIRDVPHAASRGPGRLRQSDTVRPPRPVPVTSILPSREVAGGAVSPARVHCPANLLRAHVEQSQTLFSKHNH